MWRMWRLLTPALLAYVTACQRPTDDAAAVRAVLQSLMDEHAAAAVRIDQVAAASIFAPDGRFMFQGMPDVPGQDSLRNVMAAGWAVLRPVEVHFETDDVFVYGDTAFHYGRYRHVLEPRDQPAFEDRGRFVLMWVRHPDGRWLIQRDITNSSLTSP